MPRFVAGLRCEEESDGGSDSQTKQKVTDSVRIFHVFLLDAVVPLRSTFRAMEKAKGILGTPNMHAPKYLIVSSGVCSVHEAGQLILSLNDQIVPNRFHRSAGLIL